MLLVLVDRLRHDWLICLKCNKRVEYDVYVVLQKLGLFVFVVWLAFDYFGDGLNRLHKEG